jgi:hypothetical protein
MPSALKIMDQVFVLAALARGLGLTIGYKACWGAASCAEETLVGGRLVDLRGQCLKLIDFEINISSSLESNEVH